MSDNSNSNNNNVPVPSVNPAVVVPPTINSRYHEDDLLVPPSSPSLCVTRRPSSASVVSSNRKRCLDFTKIKHCGRQQEMDQLVEALERSLQRSTATTIQNKNTKTNNNNTNITNINQGKSSSTYTITVIVEAESGVGKSSLLQRFAETRVQPHPSRPLIGWGKFEERTAATKPFAAIADLMEGIVEEMLQRHEGHIWLTRIVRAVGAEIFSLLEIIPGLARLGNAKKELEKWKEQQQQQPQQEEEKDPNNQMPHHHQQFQQQQQQQQVSDKSLSRISSSSSLSKVSASVTTTATSVNFEAFGDMARIEWRFERFRIAFRELLACISQHHPLVTILDDLQFAEKDSLALIQAVMENPTPNLQLLILCATRPTNDLTLSLRNFYDRQTSGGPQGMFIHLRGLSQPELCTLIQTLLDRPQVTPDIQTLASVILDKTQGNAFVVTHFLRQLEVDGLLTCNDDDSGGGNKNSGGGHSQQWTFDCLQIIAYLDGSASESVETVIVKNLQLLDDFQRSLLITAASFATSQFELVVVLLAMQALQQDNTDKSSYNSNIIHDDEQEWKTSKDVCRNRTSEEEVPLSPSTSLLPFGMLQDQLVQGRLLLETSIQNGLLEELAPGKFKFSHDRIREAAYSLLPQGVVRSRLHLKIGRQLRKWMNSKEDELEEQYKITLTDESIVMHAAKHSSLGSELVVDSSERSEIAQLNLAAAELSAKKAAFFPAMEYLRDGIHVLQPNAWTNHFLQCLKLHVALTRIQFNCGLLEECNHTANIVIHHAKSFEQKKDVYNQKLLCLLQQQRAPEAVDLCLLILQGLGYKLPKRFIPLHVIRRYITVENFLKKTSDDDIRNFPNFSDQTVDDQLNVLYRLGEMTYFGAPAIYLDLFSVDVIYMMKQKGNHPLLTPMGLMVWALVQTVKGNFVESRRFSSLSMEMAERLCKNHPTVKLRIKNLCRFFQEAWFGPLQELVQPMLADNRAVLEFGGMEDYHLEGVNASRFLFFCGRPLGEVQAECSSYMGVLCDCNREFLWDICAPLAQAVSCFMGDPEAASVLSGEILGAATLIRIEESKVDTGRFQYQLYSMILAFHFGEMEEAVSFEKAMRKNLYAEASEPPGLSTRVFYTVLVYLALFRKSKRRKHKKKALSSYKIMERWVSKGATNCGYMKSILDAERWSIDPKKGVEMVLEQFDRAVESATKMGHKHHEALACELAFNYLYQYPFIAKDKKIAYLKRSLACYEKWQGHAKVADLAGRYKHVLEESK